jgi:hypothetical protein
MYWNRTYAIKKLLLIGKIETNMRDYHKKGGEDYMDEGFV